MKHLFRLNTKCLGILALALLLPLSVNPVEAANKHCVDPNSTHPSCNGDGGGDSNYTQYMSKNWVIWGDGVNPLVVGPYEGEVIWNSPGNPVINVMNPRFCGGDNEFAAKPNPQGYLGYICHQERAFLYGRDHWNVVFLDLSFLDVCDESVEPCLVADGRDKDLCKRLTGEDDDLDFPVFIVPKRETDPLECETNHSDPNCGIDDPDPANVGRSTAYYITLHESNDEPCIEGSNREKSCKVLIPLRGYFDEECDGNKCGRMIGLQAWGHVEPAPAVEGGPVEINPFTIPQVIPIEELTVYFRGIGTNRTVASCYYDNREYVSDSWTGKFLKPIIFRTCLEDDCILCDEDKYPTDGDGIPDCLQEE